MPVLATQHSAAGAVAFAKFFIQTIDWGFATTSSAYMDHYFSPQCESCRSFSEALQDAHRKQETFVGGRFTLLGAARAEADPQRGQQAAKVRFDLGSLARFNSQHEFLDAQPGRRNANFFVSVSWIAGRWMTTWLSVAV
jgi:hypothetical protein